MDQPVRVLFLCRDNATRSQIAEGLLRVLGKEDFQVFSAGSAPQALHPLAVAIMQESNVDSSQQRSKSVEAFAGEHFDFIIVLRDEDANEPMPTLPGSSKPTLASWNYADPSAVESDDEARRHAFRTLARDLRERISLWVNSQHNLLRERGSTHVLTTSTE